MTTNKLTNRQQEILTFIRNIQRRKGFPPTRSEISEYFGFRSPNAAEDHLRALASKGAIRLKRGTARGIVILEKDGSDQSEHRRSMSKTSKIPANLTHSLPLVGKVAAGSPITAVENVEDYYAIDPAMYKPKAHYLLRVSGDSMTDAGILDGDLLAIHKTCTVQNHQIIVARIEDEVTVKRLKTRSNSYKYWLLPENEDYEPIVVDPRYEDFAIEGLVVGVIRTSTSFAI